MTKRSAMTAAAAVAVALLLGVAAMSLTLGDAPAANARAEQTPRVQRHVRTVTIQRPADAAPGTTRLVQLAATPASGGVPAEAWDDEDEHDEESESSGDDDAFEEDSYDLSHEGGSEDD
jgi:hypothetical protein